MEIPQVQSYFSEGSSKARRNSSVSVQKALNALGFGTWNELQTESDKTAGKSIKEKINEALNIRLAEVESRREKIIARDKRIAKLPDGPERRKLVFQKQQEEMKQRRNSSAPINEEQNLHESYQILLKEMNYREKRREKEKKKKEKREKAEAEGREFKDEGSEDEDAGNNMLTIGASYF